MNNEWAMLAAYLLATMLVAIVVGALMQGVFD